MIQESGYDPLGVFAELRMLAIASANDAHAFLAADYRSLDAFPLPGADERYHWLALWSDDRIALEKTIAKILGPVPVEITRSSPDVFIDWCFRRVDSFCAVDDVWSFDDFFRTVEVRFLARVFSQCAVQFAMRPSALLQRIVATRNVGLLESVVRIDPTIVHHKDLTGLLQPADNASRRAIWGLLTPALTEPVDGISRRQVKYAIGELLRWIGELRGEPVKVRSLFEAFNNFANPGKVNIVDPDLEEDVETFRKGLDRFRTLRSANIGSD